MLPACSAVRVARSLLPTLLLLGCSRAPAPSLVASPSSVSTAADPCRAVPHDPSRGPGLFFASDAVDGAGSFTSAVAFPAGATLAVVADTWAVPEELPPTVSVVSSTPHADGGFSVRFSYAVTPSEPLALVGPIDGVTAPLTGRIGEGLAPAAASIGIPQITYQVALPQGRLLQKMLRCTEASYVEQIWLETETQDPALISSSTKKIPPPGPDLAAPPRASHIFYLHGAIVAEQGPTAVSPEFGAYRFQDIVNALGETSATVHAPVRVKGPSFEQEVRALTDEIRSLLATGVDPRDVTIVGASQGGIMSLIASTNLANDRLTFVILGACSAWAETHLELSLHGRILSIYEKGDPLGGSCSTIAAKSKAVRAYREIPLQTGLRHGFLYRPLPEWVNPTLRWAQHLDVAPWGP